MIVEENQIFLKSYYECLSRSGFRIFATKNYREAASLFIVLRPEIVVLGTCSNEEKRLNFASEIIQLAPGCKMILLSPGADDMGKTERIGFDLILSTKISQGKFIDGVRALTHTKNFAGIVAQ